MNEVIPIDAVKDLRRITGARILDCRAALEIAEGDINVAAGLIRLQGTIHGFPHSLQTEARLRRVEPPKPALPTWWQSRLIQAAVGLPIVGVVIHAVIHLLGGIFGFPCP